MRNDDMEMLLPKIDFSITANRGRYEEQYQPAAPWNPSQRHGDDLDMIPPPIIGIIANERRAELEQLLIGRLEAHSALSFSGERQPLSSDDEDIRDMTMPKLNWAELAHRE